MLKSAGMLVLLQAIVIGALFGTVPVQAQTKDPTKVTSVVAAAVKDNKLTIKADNETFGDTALVFRKS